MTIDHVHGTRRPATRRLAARADTVAGIDAALLTIWSDLARQGMADPTTILARTRVLTLVVVASRPETAERAMDAVLKLAGRHPSRSLVLAFGDPDGPAAIDARVQAHCHPFGGSSEVCTEQIFLKISGEACQHPDAVATPLLVHDLPVALWWTDDPPIGGRTFTDLVALADRLVIDSGLFRDDGRARLVGLAAHAQEGLEIYDIGWMRLEPWRTLLAGLFDDPALGPFLGGIERVRVTVAQPGSVVRISRAALYLGWLAARLGWRVDGTALLGSPSEATQQCILTRRGRRIDVEVAAEAVPEQRRFRAPGALMRVEVGATAGRHRATISLVRGDDHLYAEAEVDGELRARRTAMIEPFEDAPYLADALEAPGQDPIFAAALPLAARLAGGATGSA
jgi:glucose-6-phosphate dehydrogenase assembly protein OpcA